MGKKVRFSVSKRGRGYYHISAYASHGKIMEAHYSVRKRSSRGGAEQLVEVEGELYKIPKNSGALHFYKRFKLDLPWFATMRDVHQHVKWVIEKSL